MSLKPHFNHSGRDFVTGIHHCARCEAPLHAKGREVTSHVLSIWQHFAWATYPAVMATDDRGFTREGVVAIPARRAPVAIQTHTGVSYCFECLPETLAKGSSGLDLCAGCGEEVVCTEGPYTFSEHLWKNAETLHNGPRLFFAWHVRCLPSPDFDPVREQVSKYT